MIRVPLGSYRSIFKTDFCLSSTFYVSSELIFSFNAFEECDTVWESMVFMEYANTESLPNWLVFMAVFMIVYILLV